MARPLRIEYEGGGSLSYYFESECKRVYKMQIALCFFKDVIYIEAIQ